MYVAFNVHTSHPGQLSQNISKPCFIPISFKFQCYVLVLCFDY